LLLVPEMGLESMSMRNGFNIQFNKYLDIKIVCSFHKIIIIDYQK